MSNSPAPPRQTGRLQRILALLPGWPTRTAATQQDRTSPRSRTERPITRRDPHAARLAHRLEGALEQRAWAAAKSLAAVAREIYPDDRRLIELRARLSLLQGDAVEATRLIELLGTDSAATQLLAAIAAGRSGRKLAVHLDLVGWSRRGSCPFDARRLLASLEWETGARREAMTTLQRNLEQIEDPASLRMLLAMCIADGDTERATALARRLHYCDPAGGPGGDLTGWLAALGVAEVAQTVGPDPASVERLAIELLGVEPLIPSLVAGQIHARDEQWGVLLLRGIERALPDLEDQLAAVTGLAQLAHALGRDDEARRWAIRGLQIEPLSAPLALLHAELREAWPNLEPLPGEPEPLDVVSRIVEVHPSWPDVVAVRERLISRAA
jgi:hypothetical protein